MLSLLLAWALAQDPTAALPPPPQNPPAALYLPVRVEAGVETSSTLPADGDNELRLSIIDARTLRAEITLSHDELNGVDATAIRAWRAGDDLQIVIPLASRAPTPFEPHCCLAWSQVDLLLTMPEGMPTQVTVRTERPQQQVVDEQRLVPQE